MQKCPVELRHCCPNTPIYAIVDKVLEGYEFAQEIRDIVWLIEEKDSQFYFIQESINNAFSMVGTLPYNDSEVSKAVEIRQQQPLKLLQKI